MILFNDQNGHRQKADKTVIPFTRRGLESGLSEIYQSVAFTILSYKLWRHRHFWSFKPFLGYSLLIVIYLFSSLQVFKDSITPCYNETFNFWLKKQHGRHSLWFHLYHNGDAHTLIGEAEMEIGEMPRSVTTWIPLTDSRKCNAQWGELMFSLSYLPTAERLTIVVVKARNLKMEIKENNSNKTATSQQVQSVFVKVSSVRAISVWCE